MRLGSLRGLKASDRSKEEQMAINQQMGYKEQEDEVNFSSIANVKPADNISKKPVSTADTSSAAAINNILRYKKHLDNRYEEILAEKQEAYHTDVPVVNTEANTHLDNIANEVSSYYKRFKGTDKLPLSDQQKKELAAKYDARKETYGEDNANIWLDNQFKDIVGNNQSWWEQGLNAIGHLVPTIEGGAIQAFGNVYGAIAHMLGAEGYDDNPDLNWWDSFVDDALDNPITRYGRDIEMSGSSHLLQGFANAVGLSDESVAERIAATKASATKYNPEGIGADAIVTTQEQDHSWISSATPWQALQSGGFTALSMLVGAGEAKLAKGIFDITAKGITWANRTGKAFKTAESMTKALEGIRKAQRYTDMFAIPAAVGTIEGALEGLNTKIEVERNAVQDLDEFYKNKINEEAESAMNDPELNPFIEEYDDNGDKKIKRLYTPDEIYKQIWDKYQDEYIDSRRQIDWASSKAGIHNFYANSLINGAINQTLKAGIMAPRVQETLHNSKMFGWAFRNPSFSVDDAYNVTAKASKLGAIKAVLKEPLGEGLEEYAQSLSNDTFSGAAESNIHEFIEKRFSGDSAVKVTDSFGSDYAAALTALGNSLVNKESIQSAILGAVSSTMGTIGGIGRGYHRDSNNRIVQNSAFSLRNLQRGIDSNGNQESWIDYAKRVTPWRSGAINAYNDRIRETKEDEETAKTLTEWLQNPENRAKWDGLQGTAGWMDAMIKGAESNDQFSYRKAQMGKAINDVFMLSKLKGTQVYDSVVEDLQRAASLDINSQDGQEIIQKMRASGEEAFADATDEEIIDKLQRNANKMLGLMSSVEKESRNLDQLLGRVDEDTKQSLVFGKLMAQDFKERRAQLEEEIKDFQSKIQSQGRSQFGDLDDDLRNLIVEYGSINKALKDYNQYQEQKEKAEEKIKELEAIDKEKLSDAQAKDLVEQKNAAAIANRKLTKLSGLFKRDEKGNLTNEMKEGVYNLVLNEKDIMNLDSITRATMLANGAARQYNATHQNIQKIDQLNLEISELDSQIDALDEQIARWKDVHGNTKKQNDTQVEKAEKQRQELNKQRTDKLRELDTERGVNTPKSIYSDAQQQVIDNLVQQGTDIDNQFVDKVIDAGRIDASVKNLQAQYQSILADPRAFHNYVQRAKQKAAMDIVRRRAERVANIENFEEYSQEVDKLVSNASIAETALIRETLKRKDEEQKKKRKADALKSWESNEDGQLVTDDQGRITIQDEEQKELSNFDRYSENIKKQGELIKQFVKNPNLTSNDMSMLENAMQYLSSKGIDVTDRERAVETLLEKDSEGNLGGKFRQWVEDKNAHLSPQQRAAMPYFTTIGQIVNDYVDILNGQKEDEINKRNLNPTVTATSNSVTGTTPEGSPSNSTVIPSSSSIPTLSPATSPTPEAVAAAGAGLMAIGGNSPESQQLTPAGEVAHVPTTAQLEATGQTANQPETVQSGLSIYSSKAIEIMDNYLNDNSYSPEVKAIAKQYFDDLFVNNTDYETADAIIEAVENLETRLDQVSNLQENADNDYNKASKLLAGVRNLLEMHKKKNSFVNTSNAGQTTIPSGNVEAAIIDSANIQYLQDNYGDIWPVVFAKTHAINEWNRNHELTRDIPVYFITDSDWTAQSMQSKKDYNQLHHMPIVAAVKLDEAPQNPNTTTAIQVGESWYQPIAIMPSGDTKGRGAARTNEIRAKTSNTQGRHLVTETGLPDGKPLTTRISGPNYRHADSKDKNAGDSVRSDVSDKILSTLRDSQAQEDRLRFLSKEERLNDKEYQTIRDRFLKGLVWVEQWPANAQGGSRGPSAGFIEDRLRPNGTNQNPMGVDVKPMSETVGRTSDKTLLEVIQGDNLEELVNFNSRTQRLYDEVIRPLFYYVQLKDKTAKDAKVANNQEEFIQEAQRIKDLLEYNPDTKVEGRKIKNFIYYSPNLEIKVYGNPNEQIFGEKSVYRIDLRNSTTGEAIYLGKIEVDKNGNTPENQIRNQNNAREFLRNLIYDEKTEAIRDTLKWQLPQSDVEAIETNTNAKDNIRQIVDDGLLTFNGTSLSRDPNSIELMAPVAMTGKIIYPSDTVANPENAQPSTPIGVTPQAEGAIVTPQGAQVDSNNGIVLEGSTKPIARPIGNPEKFAAAKALAEQIQRDSAQLNLFEDEKTGVSYYYTEDNEGNQTHYVRVTSIIGADEEVEQWIPDQQNVINQLKSKGFVISDSVANVLYKDTESMSRALGVSKNDILRAIAELRAEHKKNDYGPYKVPSTNVGNSMDAITRDFFADDLKTSYPNVSQQGLNEFVEQLKVFKADLDSKGITIVSNDVKAFGTITITDVNGDSHKVDVAGTLDLFGYDTNGNFYIFDMKTVRDHSNSKIQKESPKWARQISMYADLLRQRYPQFDIVEKDLRIIPIFVDYPKPKGNGKKGTSLIGPVYSAVKDGEKKGQLLMDSGNGNVEELQMDSSKAIDHKFGMRDSTIEGQVTPGYHKFNISWDNMSSTDQDIANGLMAQHKADNPEAAAPQNAVIETPASDNSGLLNPLGQRLEEAKAADTTGGETKVTQAAPIIPNGQKATFPSWDNLSEAAKRYLINEGYIDGTLPSEYEEDYNDFIATSDQAELEALYDEMHNCRSLI